MDIYVDFMIFVALYTSDTYLCALMTNTLMTHTLCVYILTKLRLFN